MAMALLVTVFFAHHSMAIIILRGVAAMWAMDILKLMSHMVTPSPFQALATTEIMKTEWLMKS
jgi:hypothetical protein